MAKFGGKPPKQPFLFARDMKGKYVVEVAGVSRVTCKDGSEVEFLVLLGNIESKNEVLVAPWNVAGEEVDSTKPEKFEIHAEGNSIVFSKVKA